MNGMWMFIGCMWLGTISWTLSDICEALKKIAAEMEKHR